MPSPHGTRSRYTYGCRCDDCREAQRLFHHDYKRRKLHEKWGMAEPDLVDSTAVRQHIEALRVYGIGWKRVAHLAGVAETVVARLAGYDTSKPAHRVRRGTQRRILAVQPIPANLAPGVRIPAGPSARRVQALIAIGYTVTDLAERAGVLPSNFRVHKYDDSHLIFAGTAARIAAMYDELCMAVPADVTSAKRARLYAQRRGWPPPLAWDDIDAGELAADDDGGCATCEDVEHLRFMGDTDQSVLAARLGLSVDGLQKHLARHRRLDLLGVA